MFSFPERELSLHLSLQASKYGGHDMHTLPCETNCYSVIEVSVFVAFKWSVTISLFSKCFMNISSILQVDAQC